MRYYKLLILQESTVALTLSPSHWPEIMQFRCLIFCHLYQILLEFDFQMTMWWWWRGWGGGCKTLPFTAQTLNRVQSSIKIEFQVYFSFKVENSRYKPLYQQIAGLSQMGRAIIVHLSMSSDKLEHDQ